MKINRDKIMKVIQKVFRLFGLMLIIGGLIGMAYSAFVLKSDYEALKGAALALLGMLYVIMAYVTKLEAKVKEYEIKKSDKKEIVKGDTVR